MTRNDVRVARLAREKTDILIVAVVFVKVV